MRYLTVVYFALELAYCHQTLEYLVFNKHLKEYLI